jgi:hypothetical protein
MTVPSSGPIKMVGIFSEKNEDDYGAENIDGETDLSLRGLCSNSHNDTGSGGNINLNANFADTADGGANLDDPPFAMSEMRNYNHTFVASLHTTTFQPEFRTWVVPYQPVRAGSGFTTSLNSSNNSPTNLGSVTSQGTFSIGGKSGVNLASLYNYDSNQSSDSSNGEKIVLQFHHASGSNFTDSGWSTCKIYSGSDNTGTLVVTLTRSSATSFSSTIQNSANVRATYTFNGTRAFSNHFGTDTTASNNSQHFLEIAP